MIEQHPAQKHTTTGQQQVRSGLQLTANVRAVSGAHSRGEVVGSLDGVFEYHVVDVAV